MTYHVMVRCPEVDKAVQTGTVCDVKTFEALAEKTMRFMSEMRKIARVVGCRSVAARPGV
jgi:hypothetical protein